MAATLEPVEVVRRRLRAQRLSGEPFASPAAAVACSGAVQAQEYAEALWSLGMRVHDVTAADVEAACDRGEILRTHVLRPTWHFVAAADLGWLLRLTGERVQAKSAGRRRELELDDETLARSDEALARALSDGEPRIRRELADLLEAAGIDTTGSGSRTRRPRRARGGDRQRPAARPPSHVLRFEDRVPAAPAALARGRRRRARATLLHEPRPGDAARLRVVVRADVADGKAGVAAAGARLSVEEDEDGRGWIAGADAPADPPRSSDAYLLGTYDEMLVAYRDLRYVHPDGRASAEFPTRSIVIGGETVERGSASSAAARSSSRRRSRPG